ncbi:MAG TPA: DUF2330 domain-containing protein [Enhygromyxa sp.]|nr:DUF2330 domain-containing protein [Enhygromyxa sp.]
MLKRLQALSLATLTVVGLALPREADAFCGFYVAGADAQLYNDATMVVLMRDGTRTVLSMQNDYQGPPEDFAMVVPVPVVLGEDDVKILPHEVFDRVDKLAAPRLVEYWEQDPCNPHQYDIVKSMPGIAVEKTKDTGGGAARDFGVTIEAQFEVGEYQIVILSAQESTGLEAWLRQEKYNIPAGAEPLLRPYVESGSKFFVAKVDSQKVRFETREDGVRRARLSPLRFHYDSQEFALPIRLGLINASGPQDLLVHILAREVRYEVANYSNVAIPTNLDVEDDVRTRFGSFYASLFDHTLTHNPNAVVTEYAWAAGSCDPCPEPALSLEELVTLGADVLPSYERTLSKRKIDERYTWSIPGEFVLTRLHARYDAGSLGEDLVFQAAPAIVGGREFLQENNQLERGAIESPSGYNNFQARYAIRHAWTGPIECDHPQRGIWGGPWPDVQHDGQPTVARELAFVARDVELASVVTEQAKLELERTVGPLPTGPIEPPKPKRTGSSDDGGGGGCAHCSTDDGRGGGLLGLGVLALLGLVRRRRIDRPRLA